MPFARAAAAPSAAAHAADWPRRPFHLGKVNVFLEGHKNLQNLHRRFDVYLVSVKSRFCNFLRPS